MSSTSTATSNDEPVTPLTCYQTAARLLRNAEMHTDRDLMDKYDTIARTWIVLGQSLEETTEYV
jgi:hypothetical protein